MYVHGYGSDGNATKGRILREMFNGVPVLTPTFDYDRLSPREVQRQLVELCRREHVAMMVGSSMGGYHTLCGTSFFEGPVWAINPVSDIKVTLQRITAPLMQQLEGEGKALAERRLAEYEQFDAEVFRCLPGRAGQVNLALSTDDELLGDHSGLLRLFPLHGRVVWKDDCGHRFMRFAEMAGELRATWDGVRD